MARTRRVPKPASLGDLLDQVSGAGTMARLEGRLMARTRRVVVERESTPAPGNMAEDLAAMAAKVFEAGAGPAAPLPMSEGQHAQVAGALLGQSIHVAIVHMGEHGASAIDAEGASFVCSGKPEGRRTVVVAQLDDPRFCPTCLLRRPSAAGSSVRVVTVLVSP